MVDLIKVEKGRHLQGTEHENSYQTNLPALIHLQAEEDIEGENDGDEISQNRQASGRYAERELLDAVSLDQGVPVDLDGNALEKDDEEHGDHQGPVEDDGRPDDLSNQGLDTRKAQQEYQDRLLHQRENRIVYSAYDINPDQARPGVESLERNVPVVNADIHLLQH